MLKIRYPVVASDFDGTLLRSDDTISQYTQDVIKEFISLGGLFLVATGRMHCAIVNRLEDAGLGDLDTPVISYQGALVKTSISDKILFDNSLDLDVITDVISEARARDIYIHGYLDDILYVEKEMPWTRAYVDFLRIDFELVGDLLEFLTQKIKDGKHSCHKLLMMLEADQLESQMRHFLDKFGGGIDYNDPSHKFKSPPRAIFNTSSEHLLECVSLNAGKDKAIEQVIKSKGYTMKDVLAVGDSLNDFTMVRRAGMGVAVQNADPRVKTVAKHITTSNDNDGVARAIETLILNEA
ncbi:MAG TPA: HAD family hydrolase [Clostridiales bacterium]|jgi:Cof subfamily protein (haloacid dehalogenase superfamily)|nr:HAD family hydrolase [Clostridiales bacterium]